MRRRQRHDGLTCSFVVGPRPSPRSENLHRTRQRQTQSHILLLDFGSLIFHGSYFGEIARSYHHCPFHSIICLATTAISMVFRTSARTISSCNRPPVEMRRHLLYRACRCHPSSPSRHRTATTHASAYDLPKNGMNSISSFAMKSLPVLWPW